MKVKNVHSRLIVASHQEIAAQMATLASENDQVWPDQWPRMRFNGPRKPGTSGGHGPIRYQILKWNPEKEMIFRFEKPKGFKGIHRFQIHPESEELTRVSHFIEMETSFWGTILWGFAIKSLHNALLQDGLDKIESAHLNTPKRTVWNLWVLFLRFFLK